MYKRYNSKAFVFVFNIHILYLEFFPFLLKELCQKIFQKIWRRLTIIRYKQKGFSLLPPMSENRYATKQLNVRLLNEKQVFEYSTTTAFFIHWNFYTGTLIILYNRFIDVICLHYVQFKCITKCFIQFYITLKKYFVY